MSYRRLAESLMFSRPYFGPALRALQGLPDRHKYMRPLVQDIVREMKAEGRPERPLQLIEIGTWAGASAITWATALNEAGVPGAVLCVDVWRPYFDLSTDCEPIYAEMNGAAGSTAAFKLFLHNITATGCTDRIRYHVGTSSDVLACHEPASFDLVYIDGDHRFPAVKSDIVAAKRLVRPGGIICGDDLELCYTDVLAKAHANRVATGKDYLRADEVGRDYHPGVTQAVWEELGQVCAWDGFWACRWEGRQARPLDIDTSSLELPKHIRDALEFEASDASPEPPPPAAAANPDTPIVVEAYRGFNVVRYAGKAFGLSKALGEIDWAQGETKLRDLGDDQVIIRDTLDGVRQAIDTLEIRASVERLFELSKTKDTPSTTEANPEISVAVDTTEEASEIMPKKDQNEPDLSLVVPTRGRPDRLRAMLDSLARTVSDVEFLEVVLVVDADDHSYDGFEFSGIHVEWVGVPSGQTMGALNDAGFRRARGRFVMLMNDDVIVETPRWDVEIRRVMDAFPDQICLIHVNDGIFGERLCTFPLVSRLFTDLAGGICHPGYRRYRIDDHIFHVFNLLSLLGHRRQIYLPNVLFRHENTAAPSSSGIAYQPDPEIHAIDTTLFMSLDTARKELAIKLWQRIDEFRRSETASVKMNVLRPLSEPHALRKPEYVQIWRADQPASSDAVRVTIGVVSADIRTPHARECLRSIKQHTRNYDLVVLDNNKGPNFNHSREMNRIISTCTTDLLVLTDDDVIVDAGWLDGLLQCLTPDVGLITPLHRGKDGRLTYAGIVMRPDYSGHHTHAFRVDTEPMATQTICSAMMLLDLRKIGHLRVEECYSKYFLDIDFGLKVWETGFRVVCSPFTTITHLGGATLRQGSAESTELFETQRPLFLKTWIETGRYQRLERSRLWREEPDIQSLTQFPERLRNCIQSIREHGKAEAEAEALSAMFDQYPALRDFAASATSRQSSGSRGSTSMTEVLGLSRSLAPVTTDVRGTTLEPAHATSELPARLALEGVRGFNIIQTDWFYAIPQGEGGFSTDRVRDGEYSEAYIGPTLESVKVQLARRPLPLRLTGYTRRGLRRYKTVLSSPRNFSQRVRDRIIRSVRHRVRRYRTARTSGRTGTDNNAAWPNRDSREWVALSPVEKLPLQIGGYDIYRYEFKYFAVPAGDGDFDLEDVARGEYGSRIYGHSVPEVAAQIALISNSSADRPPSTTLVLATLSSAALEERIAGTGIGEDLTILAPHGYQATPDRAAHVYKTPHTSIADWARHALSTPDAAFNELKAQGFSTVLIPWSFPETWRDNSLERLAAALAEKVIVLSENGERYGYSGEFLHRLIYNKAYLASMFESLPLPKDKRVLEIGCSDGLVSNIMASLGAAEIVGVDVMKTVGCGYPGPRLRYATMEAERLDIADQYFDCVFSIATLEHVANPPKVLDEVVRTLKIGGHAYIQAAPLYHSPFGHHMFQYFSDQPWIHLLKSREEIEHYAVERGIDRAVTRDLGITMREYLTEMLNPNHLNGLRLAQFHLQEFMSRDDIKVLKFNVTYEGEDLLTPRLAKSLARYPRNVLTEHGFELAFTRLR